MELSNSLFKKEIPNDVNLSENNILVTDAQEVGFYNFSVDWKNSIVNFQLAFMIKRPNPAQISSCPLFGDLCSGRDVLEELSKKGLNERIGFKVWIDFQY